MGNVNISEEFASTQNHLYELLKEELRQSIIDFVDDNLDKEAAECTVELLRRKYPNSISIIEKQVNSKSEIKIPHNLEIELRKNISRYIKEILTNKYPRLIEALKCGQEGITEKEATEKAPYHFKDLSKYLKSLSNRRILDTQKTIERYRQLVTLLLKQEHLERYAEFHAVGLADD